MTSEIIAIRKEVHDGGWRWQTVERMIAQNHERTSMEGWHLVCPADVLRWQSAPQVLMDADSESEPVVADDIATSGDLLGTQNRCRIFGVTTRTTIVVIFRNGRKEHQGAFTR